MEPAQIQPEPPVQKKERSWWKIVSILIILLVVINLGVLDYFIFFPLNNLLRSSDDDERLKTLEQRVDTLALKSFSASQATGSSETIVIYPTAGPTLPPQIIEKETVIEKVVEKIPASFAKEFYVPLGSASVKTEDFKWVDTGAEATLDLANYPGVKAVSFEAALSIPAGQVIARLYNVTDGYEIPNGELVGDGSASKLYRSGNLILPSGSKTYRVQMRTSLNFTSTMDNARLRIELE